VNSAARVPVRRINFGHRTLSAAGGEDGPGATVPAGFHSHRGDLDVRRVEDFLFRTRSATWIRPANLLSFFLPVFIDVPGQVGSNAAGRRFIFARLIRFRATSILPDVSAEDRSSLIDGWLRLAMPEAARSLESVLQKPLPFAILESHRSNTIAVPSIPRFTRAIIPQAPRGATMKARDSAEPDAELDDRWKRSYDWRREEAPKTRVAFLGAASG